MLTLRRPTDLKLPRPELDPAQEAAVHHRGGVLRVLGAPGTGKTTVAVECVVDRVRRDGLAPDQCLVLSPSRLAAAAVRDRVTARLHATSTTSLSRTHQALGFGILRQAAPLAGTPAPRLLSGPEQDVLLHELLAGHSPADGTDPGWPDGLRAALGTRGFRDELRDLLMRAVEHGVEPAQLAALGRRHERPEWEAAARVLAEYDEVTALSRPGSYDPAWILGAAADLLEEDPGALHRVRGGLRLIAVDDAQELTAPAARLLSVLRGPDTDLVLIGDADTAVQAFRGADPHRFADLAGRWGEPRTLTLATAYRQPSVLRQVTCRVAARVGAVHGTGHRAAGPARDGGRCDVAVLRSPAQEAAHIAAELRRVHLLDGVPWSDMAVVVRGRGRTGALQRALMAAGVPVSVPGAVLPVRDEPAVRPLLALLDVVLALARGEREAVEPDAVLEVLGSPVGQADAVALRRLRRALRRREREAGGSTPTDELLVEAVLDPAHLTLAGPDAAPARRVAQAVAAGLKAAQWVEDPVTGWPGWAPGVTAETVLWAIWEATGLASAWSRTALGGGVAGMRADRDLDAVVALFGAAAAYADRLPGMGPEGLLRHVRGQDVAGDTLAPRAAAERAVEVLTAQAAAGREWPVVVVAGVQEGVWPDLRLRGSLLGSEQLVDVLTGRAGSVRAAQAAVRHDETRQFLVAVSRASRRLLVTAVRSEDEQPSAYLDVIDPRAGDRPLTEVSRALSLPALVGELRREVVQAGGPDGGSGAARRDQAARRDEAARRLARLARAGVPCTDPAQWWATTEISDDRPLRDPEAAVPVSPSKVQQFDECGLRWLLTASGGEGPGVERARLGTLVHEIAAAHPDGPVEAMHRTLDERWPELGLRGWQSGRARAQARAMLHKTAEYAARARAEGWDCVGVEVDLEVSVGRAVLRGRVDRLERNAAGDLRVVDLKTTAAPPTSKELPRHPQLGVYQVAVEEGAFAGRGDADDAAPRSAGAALLQVGNRHTKSPRVQAQAPLRDDSEDPAWAHTLVVRTADGMAAGRFQAVESAACQRCPVADSCPIRPEGESVA